LETMRELTAMCWYLNSYDIDGKCYRALRDPENENKIILIPAE